MKGSLTFLVWALAIYIVTVVIFILLNLSWTAQDAMRPSEAVFSLPPRAKMATQSPCAPDYKGHKLGLHLVTYFRSFSTDISVVDRESYSRYVALKVQERDVMTTLLRNLRNPNITQVHLIHTENARPLIKGAIKGCITKKLKPHKVKKSKIFYSDIFKYINMNNLHRHLLMVASSDVYLGDGFHLIKGDRLGERNMVYALTRRGTRVRGCVSRDQCGDFNQYTGSHDAFVLNLTHRVTKSVIREMNVNPELLYAQNALIWILKTKVKLVVRNPCKVIHVHKANCEEVKGERVRYRGHGLAPFSGL